MNLECGNCNTVLPTKQTYNLHKHFCNSSESSPTEAAMFQCILYLTEKCEILENKIAKIHTSTTRLRRKHIEEYLHDVLPPKIAYEEWISFIQVTESHLQRIAEYDLEEGIKELLSPLLDNIPICGFVQKPGIFYIYDKCAWRMINSDEFTSLVKSIVHKAKRAYSNWCKDHADEINSNDKKRDESMLLMKKLIIKDKDVSTIKKWFFGKIAVSLNNIDF